MTPLLHAVHSRGLPNFRFISHQWRGYPTRFFGNYARNTALTFSRPNLFPLKAFFAETKGLDNTSTSMKSNARSVYSFSGGTPNTWRKQHVRCWIGCGRTLSISTLVVRLTKSSRKMEALPY